MMVQLRCARDRHLAIPCNSPIRHSHELYLVIRKSEFLSCGMNKYLYSLLDEE